MSCDLTDPAILEAYQEIISGTPVNWLILGYHDTRDKISLYSKGTEGLEELKSNLREEVLYGFVRIEDRFALLAYVSDQVSGLRRARALVHGKAVGALFKQSHAQINSSSLAELSEDRVRARLGLIEGPPTPDPSGSPNMPSSPTPPTAAPRPVTPISPATPNQYANMPGTPVAEIDNPAVAAAAATAQLPSPIVANSTSSVPGSPSMRPSSPGSPGSPMQTHPTRTRTERQKEIEAAERRAREEMERQRQAEMVKRQRETQEREQREQELMAHKQALELERRRKEETDRVAREAMKKQLMEMERMRGAGLSGYVTIQNAGSPFWKRRFYAMRGQVLSLYRDENDRAPVAEMHLGGQVAHIQDASLEVLIPHSFAVDMHSGETHYFFSDTAKDKELAIAGFMKCNESA
ncbi:hypothetical protein DFQ27_006604 [Actinomortierella ambigua]|uniref:ADF-H domain-containing protein n=1 Tax=Actinomortierella ambigua TaxID=1343610 RepID=A0A9P6PVC4_9FUNG|nr:hypothetical protein DFQ27_006604 [Actinomortierella ambigua]